MKLITLNIWGGHLSEPLSNFFTVNQDIDIFCLQEVYHAAKQSISTENRFHQLNIYDAIQSILTAHQGYFLPIVNHTYGLAIFIKKHINVLVENNILIHINDKYIGIGPTHSRSMQVLTCQINQQKFYVLNVHGLWNGAGKSDSEERLLQSIKIKQFLSEINAPKILSGDFNLLPETDSLLLLEDNMRNLIKEYRITSTRTSYYSKPVRFADYVLISDDIIVNNFSVMPAEVSDHSPLLLDFDF